MPQHVAQLAPATIPINDKEQPDSNVLQPLEKATPAATPTPVAKEVTLLSEGVTPAQDVETALKMATEIAQEPPENQKDEWAQFLNYSAEVARRENSSQLWLWRATAALKTQDGADGKEAGEKLRELGALDSEVPAVRKLVGALVVEGWFSSRTLPPQGFQERTKDDVVKFINEWKKRWESKDMDAYLACYDENFIRITGDADSGLKLKRKIDFRTDDQKYFIPSAVISVSIDDLDIEQENNGVCWKATFRQKYDRTGPSGHSLGTKTLQLKPGGKLGFLIFSEDFKPAEESSSNGDDFSPNQSFILSSKITTFLSLRSAAGSDNDEIYELTPDENCEIISTGEHTIVNDSVWVQVTAATKEGEKTGWVNRKYLSPK